MSTVKGRPEGKAAERQSTASEAAEKTGDVEEPKLTGASVAEPQSDGEEEDPEEKRSKQVNKKLQQCASDVIAEDLLESRKDDVSREVRSRLQPWRHMMKVDEL